MAGLLPQRVRPPALQLPPPAFAGTAAGKQAAQARPPCPPRAGPLAARSVRQGVHLWAEEGEGGELGGERVASRSRISELPHSRCGTFRRSTYRQRDAMQPPAGAGQLKALHGVESCRPITAPGRLG